MERALKEFESIVRRTHAPQLRVTVPNSQLHAFDERNIHPNLPPSVRRLFDDGHYSQATFEAFKFIDKEVQRHSGDSESGYKLMARAFAEANPLIKLNGGSTTTEKDEQKGYQFLFSGATLAIRNPRGHEVALQESPDACLDHLSLASLLLRRLEEAGFLTNAP